MLIWSTWRLCLGGGVHLNQLRDVGAGVAKLGGHMRIFGLYQSDVLFPHLRFSGCTKAPEIFFSDIHVVARLYCMCVQYSGVG